jgi:hypothetical protein
MLSRDELVSVEAAKLAVAALDVLMRAVPYDQAYFKAGRNQSHLDAAFAQRDARIEIVELLDELFCEMRGMIKSRPDAYELVLFRNNRPADDEDGEAALG